MSILEGLAGIAAGGASGVLGGVIALVGTQLTKRDERKTLELKLSQEIKIAEIEAKEAENEFKRAQLLAEIEIDRLETEADIASDVEASKSFRESLKVQTISTGNAIVDAVRGLMRPMITAYMLLIMTYIAYQISRVAGGFEILPMSTILDLYEHIINQVMFLTVTCVTWWFGSRPSAGRK